MFIAVEITLSQTSIETKISMLRQMIISNETIYVGGVGGIASYYKENMTEMSFNANYSNVWLLLYDEKREELIQCNEYYDNVSHCSKQTASLRNTGIESTDITVDMRYYPTYKMIYTNEVTASIVVIGANSAEVLNTSYGILSFNLKDFALFKTKPIRRGPMNIERNDKENLTLTFKSTFSRVSHFYFLFQIHAKNQFETSRMGKLCITFKDKDEIERYKTGYYHSYEDMNITCEYNGRSLRKIENAVDEGGFVIFLFFHNEFSVICAHSWAAIEKDYLKSRKSLLLCDRNTPAKNGRYFEPDTKLGTNIYEHCFHNKTYCDKGTYVCRTLEGDICNITYHHTLVGGKGIENMDDVFDINKTITALDILQTSGFSVLYFGTKDGQLGMVYLQLGGKRENFTTKIVSVANAKVINIKVEKDSVYYITEKKIGKIDINDCSIHKDCESCMNSFNSSCEWDYDENRNDKELGHIEESEMAYSEINPVAELNNNSSIINHQPVNIEYERLGHRPLTNPYNHLQHLAVDNQIRDIKNIGNRTVSPSDYMNLKL
ncbi:Hypothetical predicted protein [Mytilus galloprovincialis]|uniref:Sema domain-containing protein n=1 Tax=Mytilus galloprovincialis TaxID=29158 RepID=A0A8B6CHK8_MYTGA|nr:Hypothetical predicted protein [Mytilus galloprovincialis]